MYKNLVRGEKKSDNVLLFLGICYKEKLQRSMTRPSLTLTRSTHRFDIDDQSDTMLQEHVLGNSGHSLLNKDQIRPDINYPLYVILQELPFLQTEKSMAVNYCKPIWKKKKHLRLNITLFCIIYMLTFPIKPFLYV